jgi:hypothetical protein
MSSLAGSRKRVAIWVLVKLFLTVCGWQDDAPAAMSLDQPLTSVSDAGSQQIVWPGNIRK